MPFTPPKHIFLEPCSGREGGREWSEDNVWSEGCPECGAPSYRYKLDGIAGMNGITFGSDGKFDLQLKKAMIDERRLADVFAFGNIENPKLELKSETWQWEQTKNICIEFSDNGKPSGLAITEADYWVHELKRKEDTLVWLMFPIERMRHLAREAYRKKQRKPGSGDGKRMDVVWVRLRDILA